MSPRTVHALPTDVARAFDTTVTDAQIANNTFLGGGDDRDALYGMIEDAEAEFRNATDKQMRLSRVGSLGTRESYEEQTYRVKDHQSYRARFSEFTFDYDFTEFTVNLDHNNVIPFDSAEGDEIFVYRGLGSDPNWEDITDDQTDCWTVINHRTGQLNVSERELYRAMFGSVRRGLRITGGLDKARFAISYRYGTLGGGRNVAGQTGLDGSLNETATTTVSVDDGSVFPVGDGTIIVQIEEEYLRVEPDPTNDQMTVVERGVRGTRGAEHDSTDDVLYTPPAVRKAVAARAGMQLVQSARYQDFLPNSEADMDQSDVLAELQDTYEMTVAALS
jgi:hypothetical protein